MRRFITCWVVVGLILAAIPLGSADVAAQQATSATTTDALNLRAQPATTATVITVMPRGETVSITGAVRSGFYPVTYGGRSGWASQDYLALAKPAASSEQGGTVTSALNLRAGPSNGQPVITVMPAGASIVITGTSSNGYLAVKYGGYSGFAHQDWIRQTGTSAPALPPTTPAPTTSGQARTTDSLNLRAGAGTSYSVVVVMPAGANVTLTGRSANGFLELTYSGRTGWASAQWLQVLTGVTPPRTTPAPTAAPARTPVPTVTPAAPVVRTSGTGRTLDSLNLRAEASTSSRVLTVIPARASITLSGQSSGVFHRVTYNGQTGWAHRDWIQEVDTTSRPTSSATVTTPLNLRSGPATSYGVVAVMPQGATVALTGQQSNGFHSVTYNGVTGWAFTTYLSIRPASQPQPTIPPTPVPTSVPTRVPTVAPTQVPTTTPAKPVTTPYPVVSTTQGFHYTNAIVGPVRGTPEQAIQFARRVGSVRMPDVELYIREVYRLAPQLGFDPSLIVAQSALETGYWRSTWWNERLNPAGLALNDDPSTHPYSDEFPDGTIAARAHLAHMHAEVYGSRRALPTDLQGVDSTYELVFRAGWAGTIVTLDDLAGTWATDPAYGYKISRVAAEIFG